MPIAHEILTLLKREGLVETIRSLRERVFWKALKILRPSYLSSPYGPKFHLNLADTTFRYYIRGAYGHLLSDFIKSLDREFVFLDIGANQGLYSFVAAANPVCTKVWAFEPVKGTFDLLRSNAVINEDSNKIEFVNCAISNAKGKRTISISPRHTGAASLERHYSGAVAEVISCIDSSVLDDIVAFATPVVGVVKIDTEGHEPVVIGELAKTRFWPSVGFLFFEVDADWFDADDLFARLKIEGFQEVCRSKNRAKHYDVLMSRAAG
jgi:FkbM family methyltransferase